MNATQISKTQDVIDSRDILERVDALRGEGAEGAAEMAALLDLLDEVRNVAGDSPEDGVILIHYAHFEDYARELAEELGAVPTDYSWPTSHIDWAAAADSLLMDYSSVDFGGETFYVRS